MDKNFQEQFAGVIKFTPPLYKQRYQFVKDLVEKYKPKKVADLGCADCTLLWMLKYCSCIEVLAGLDSCASVMKEKIIEHLEESELNKFPEVVFGFMSPSIVVISTPNSDFNPLLKGVTLFRHPDHKFEWNQVQFQSWALETAARYNYSVEFTGVGLPPTGMEKVGFCTQIAVFVRKYSETSESAQLEKPLEAVYKTVFKAVYPSLKDERYLQNAVVSEVIFTIQIIKQNLLDCLMSEHKECNDDPTERKSKFHPSMNRFSEDLRKLVVEKSLESFVNGNVAYIPLATIFSFPKVNRLCGTFEKLCKLIAGKVTLSSDGSAVVFNIEH
ncbi:small RNA 2'-O-methyltransferase isoform X2 [Colius striatus]|uniref:small RNA 2'-O-methyltransferase isoform X2 n=1 Tax=Colius striatus TaxID=57412 RepID=UPI002B1CEAE4|nr:small RNA 2'-O-methyltransferase isoform X2 [Colius striatus]